MNIDDLFNEFSSRIDEHMRTVTLREMFARTIAANIRELEPGMNAHALLISTAMIVMLMAERQGIDLDGNFKKHIESMVAGPEKKDTP